MKRVVLALVLFTACASSSESKCERERHDLGLVLLGLAPTACSATSKEPCTQKDLGAIVAHHEAELAEKCAGQGTNCSAREELNAKFKEEVRGWVRCDSEGAGK